MSERASEKEQSLYEPIRKTMERVFNGLGDCHLEITTRGFSDKLKRVLDDVALYMLKVEGFFPDITGFVKEQHSTEIIVIEVKLDDPMLKDIFQAKDYAQVFNAKYAILASPRPISEERRRLILKRPEIISRYPKESVIIAQYDVTNENFEADKEMYYGSLPEPFKTNSELITAEMLNFHPIKFEEKGENAGVHLIVSNGGISPVEIAEVRAWGTTQIRQIALKPKSTTLIQLSKGWLPGSNFTIDVFTRNGRKYHLEATAPSRVY